MAVTLPVMLLVYEWIYQRERQWWPALSVGLLTALSIFGKIFGADPLMAQAAYKPVFTLARYFASSTVHLNDLLYTGFFFTPSRALILWFAMALIAWRVRTSPLRFALLFIFISPLPVIFLEGRTRACLYIPLLGWAIFAAVLFDALVTRISRNRAWVRHSLLGAGVVLLAILIQGRKLELMPLYAHEGELTESVIAQFRSLDLQVEPGSSVLLVDDPFVDWDTKFIADLSFRDRSVNVWLQNKNHFSDEEIHEKMKYVFRFENGRLVRLDPITYHSPN